WHRTNLLLAMRILGMRTTGERTMHRRTIPSQRSHPCLGCPVGTCNPFLNAVEVHIPRKFRAVALPGDEPMRIGEIVQNLDLALFRDVQKAFTETEIGFSIDVGKTLDNFLLSLRQSCCQEMVDETVDQCTLCTSSIGFRNNQLTTMGK